MTCHSCAPLFDRAERSQRFHDAAGKGALDLRRPFEKFDKTGTGRVSRREFRDGCREPVRNTTHGIRIRCFFQLARHIVFANCKRCL